MVKDANALIGAYVCPLERLPIFISTVNCPTLLRGGLSAYAQEDTSLAGGLLGVDISRAQVAKLSQRYQQDTFKEGATQ